MYAIYFFRDVASSWQYLESDMRHRMQNFVQDLPSLHFDELEFLLGYTPLQKQARHRVKNANLREIADSTFFEMPIEVIDRLIEIYLASRSYEEANFCAKYQIIPRTADFSGDHVRKIIAGIKNNAQVCDSIQIGRLILRH